MRALEIRALTKTFAGGRALDRVDLDVVQGEVHALLGENGSGKSTLIKILSGYHRPDPGSIVRIGDEELSFGNSSLSYAVGARFVHQDLGLVEAASILDNLAYGPGFPTRAGTIRTTTARLLAQQALERVDLHVDPETLVEALSPAQKTGVGVARALLSNDDVPVRILVLDEPTARLPEQEVNKLLDIVKTVAHEGIAVLYVSHRLDEIFEIAHNVTVLRDGQKVITRPVEGLTRDELLHHLLGSELEKTHRDSSKVQSTENPILRVSGIGNEVLNDVSFDVRPGEIVGIAGISGSGREALCGTIFGGRKRDVGEVFVADSVLTAGRPDLAIAAGVAYVPAERKLHGAFMDLSATENISISNLRDLWRGLAIRLKLERRMGQTWFDKLGVKPAQASAQMMSSFSGGNQQKIVFGKWFQRQPLLFLLDEPTQGVDVGAKAELHRTLFTAAENGASIVMSSGDVDELVSTCDRVLILRSGRIVAELSGKDLTPYAMSRAALGIEDSSNEGSVL